MKYRDIAIASAFGAIIGLTIALSLGWSVFLAPMLGSIAGFLCYRPSEIGSTVTTLARDLRTAGKKTQWAETSKRAWQGIHTGALATLCVITCVCSTMFLLTAVHWIGIPPIPVRGGESGPPPVAVVIFVESFLLWGLGLSSVLVLSLVTEVENRWAFPLLRWLSRSLGFGKERHVYTYSEDGSTLTRRWRDIFLLCLVMPPILQVMSLVMIVALLDLVFTILLACATTRRLASMLGAVLGCTGGATIALLGVESAPLICLPAGGSIGWFAGPLFYRLREALDTPCIATVSS